MKRFRFNNDLCRCRRQPVLLLLSLIILATGLIASKGSDDRGAPSPAGVYKAFETAISTKNLRAFMRVCNKPISNFSPGLSCGSLLNEAWHLGRTYSRVDEKTSAQNLKKAVIELQSTGQDKVPIHLFFLLEKGENNMWTLKNINDNRSYAETYLKN